MKKILFWFLAVALSASLLAGCSIQVNPVSADSESDQSSSSTSKRSSSEDESEESQSSPEEEASSEQEESSRRESSRESSGGADVSGMGGRLADTYIDLLNSDTYYMKFRIETAYDGERSGTVSELAVKGEDMAMIIEVEDGSTHMILKEGKTFIVDHENKSVMAWANDGSTTAMEGVDFPESGMDYRGTGTAELFGVRRTYEEYSTPDAGDVRFFFDGSKLVGYEFASEGLRMQMEILDMSDNIPSRMFEIPANYSMLSI